LFHAKPLRTPGSRHWVHKMTRTALIVVDMLVDFFGGKSDLPTPVHL
jgi:hypothetical protein